MNVHVAGGGPAGLFFAVLARRLKAEVTVFEMRPRAHTFGWGIAFSQGTIDTLRAGDPETAERVLRRAQTWHSLDIVHRRSKVSLAGQTYHGLSRVALLEELYARCEELGVRLRFEEAWEPREAELVVGADGLNSAVRKRFEKAFGPTLTPKPNYHIWYGTRAPFTGVTLTYREHEAGVFVAHSYPMDGVTQTFVVDCDARTFQRAGFSGLSDEATRALLEDVFREDLGRKRLLSKESKWIHFRQVRNRRWVHGNAVLLGDAAHNVHFSAGAGTSLAFQDALALYRALSSAGSVPEGLAFYEEARKPVMDDLQDKSEAHRSRLEEAKSTLGLEPLDFAAALVAGPDPAARAEVRRLVTVSDLRRPAKPG